jgi:hypothetical protein
MKFGRAAAAVKRLTPGQRVTVNWEDRLTGMVTVTVAGERPALPGAVTVPRECVNF